jgi:hypothetical protein
MAAVSKHVPYRSLWLIRHGRLCFAIIRRLRRLMQMQYEEAWGGGVQYKGMVVEGVYDGRWTLSK